MWKRIALAAGIAGLVAGLVLTALQQEQVAPLIRTAEVLEQAGLAPYHPAEHSHPESGERRLVATAASNIVLATGFALLLAAGLLLRAQSGWRAGIVWGAAGYLAFFVAPSLGMPPELPGLDSAPLAQKTIWWLLTATLTGAGMWLMVFSPRPLLRLLGLALAAAPHFLGAPHARLHEVTATHDLTTEFICATAITNAVFWLLLGTLVGTLLGAEKRVPSRAI